MLEKYHAKVVIAPGKRVKVPTVLQMRETIENSQEVRTGQNGVMMWRLHFQEWMAKPRNGALTAEESDNLFYNLTDTKANPNSIVDHLHSNSKFPKDKERLWVNKKYVINF